MTTSNMCPCPECEGAPDDNDVATDRPWARLIDTDYFWALPSGSQNAFIAFIRGDDMFDDGGSLPVYERAEFWGNAEAQAMRKYMRKYMRSFPAIITFEEVVV